MDVRIIVGMTTLTVASAVSQKVFTSVGKADEAQYVDLATKSILGATAIGIFANFIKSILELG